MEKSPQLLPLGRERRREWIEQYGGSIWQAVARLRSTHPRIDWLFGFTGKTMNDAPAPRPYLSLQIEGILDIFRHPAVSQYEM